MCMGIADLIPGISGGTIAFITGVYEKLLTGIKGVFSLLSPFVLKRLFSSEFLHICNRLHLPFLITLFSGVLLSIWIFSGIFLMLQEKYPSPLFAFFFSLVFFSAVSLIRPHITKIVPMILFIIGICCSLILLNVSFLETSGGTSKLFFSGIIASSAMLLPGISGSFILLALGEYFTMLNAVSSFDWMKIIVFVLGFAYRARHKCCLFQMAIETL